MKLDPLRLRKHREQLGYSQKDVADKSNVSERTMQRAEAGISVSNENAAAIAAALQTKLRPLLLSAAETEGAPSAANTITLRRATSGRAILDMLDHMEMGAIQCDVEATSENLELLKSIATLLEINMRDPLDEDMLNWPPRRSLADRLDLIARLNDTLNQLDALGIGVFTARTFLHAHLPTFNPYDGWREPAEATGCSAARIVISDHPTEKIVRTAYEVNWPVKVDEDFCDEFPF